jgi:hypothetical protein
MRWTWNRGRLSVQPLREKLLRVPANSFLWWFSSCQSFPSAIAHIVYKRSVRNIARDHNRKNKAADNLKVPTFPRGHVAPLIREVFDLAVTSDSDHNKSVQYRSTEKPRPASPQVGSLLEMRGHGQKRPTGTDKIGLSSFTADKGVPLSRLDGPGRPHPQGWGRHSVRWPRSEHVEAPIIWLTLSQTRTGCRHAAW